MDPSQISDIIRHRRTIKPKLFCDQPIDEAVISTMLENANWAPTHGMTEPWRFRVFVGPARQRLADFLAATYKELTPPDQFKPNKFEGMSVNAMLAQAVIVIGMQRQPSEKIAELDEIMAVACAVQNMHLTAAAHGVGAFWSTNVAAVSDQMRQFVGLGPKDRTLGLFYLGYPESDWPTCQRGAIDDKVEWVRE
ncbi:MAG: nitroreductase [Pirellulaceae bacterium]